MNNLKCIEVVSYNGSTSNRLSEVGKKGTYFRKSGDCYQNKKHQTFKKNVFCDDYFVNLMEFRIARETNL